MHLISIDKYNYRRFVNFRISDDEIIPPVKNSQHIILTDINANKFGSIWTEL
jgi:hypothetical protein